MGAFLMSYSKYIIQQVRIMAKKKLYEFIWQRLTLRMVNI